MSTLTQSEHYTIISADCHAGGSHEHVPRVPRPGVPRRLRRVARQVQEPVQGPARHRPARPQLGRRDAQRRAGGRRRRRRGRVPEHGAAVLPELRAVRRAADSPRSTSTGSPASTPTTAGWSTSAAQFPERRAGIGQIFLNDIDDAIEDVSWIKEHGLRGGILLPNVAPDVKWVKPLYDPEYDRLWAVLEDLEIPVNVHGGTGSPDYGQYPTVRCCSTSTRSRFYSQRPFVQLLLSGVFERFPRLKFVMTESGCAWVPAAARAARRDDRASVAAGRDRRDPVHRGARAAALGHRVLPPELLDGREPARARPTSRRATSIGADRFMWGSDYPHDEGTAPVHPRAPARRCSTTLDPTPSCARSSASNAAELYDFDLDALAPLAEQSARPSTRSRSRSPSCPRTRTRRC